MNTPSRPRFPLCRTRLVGAAFLAFSTASLAHASLLVYDGFNGYTTGALEGQKPNANTTGLDTTVGYYDGATPSRAANYTIQSTGLTFGSLQTSGGAVAFSAGTNVIGADLAIGSAFTGTLWSSYLVKLTAQGTAATDGAVVRIGATPSDSAGGHFNSWADARPSTNASTNVAVGYSATALTTANGTATLALNTTYIIISSFTNVGQSLSTGTTGVAKLWALTASQYAAFQSAGGDEAALAGTSVTATATQTVTSGTFTFSSNDAFALVTVTDTGTFDELRFGSSLADVTPAAVPEPATYAAFFGVLTLAAAVLHRRRRD